MNATKSTTVNQINYELGQKVNVTYTNKRGKTKSRKQNAYVKSYGSGVPRIFLIINAARRKAGQEPLSGTDMTKAANKVIAQRRRSVSYHRSGWIGAIRKLAKVKGGPRPVKGVRVIGRPKGGATIGKENSWNPFATIYNNVKGSIKVLTDGLNIGIQQQFHQAATILMKSSFKAA
jgi:hypothetical protein